MPDLFEPRGAEDDWLLKSSWRCAVRGAFRLFLIGTERNSIEQCRCQNAKTPRFLLLFSSSTVFYVRMLLCGMFYFLAAPGSFISGLVTDWLSDSGKPKWKENHVLGYYLNSDHPPTPPPTMLLQKSLNACFDAGVFEMLSMEVLGWLVWWVTFIRVEIVAGTQGGLDCGPAVEGRVIDQSKRGLLAFPSHHQPVKYKTSRQTSSIWSYSLSLETASEQEANALQWSSSSREKSYLSYCYKMPSLS